MTDYVKITPALARAAREHTPGAMFVHRGRMYVVEACDGDAHANAYIDTCTLCAPLWGIRVRERAK